MYSNSIYPWFLYGTVFSLLANKYWFYIKIIWIKYWCWRIKFQRMSKILTIAPPRGVCEERTTTLHRRLGLIHPQILRGLQAFWGISGIYTDVLSRLTHLLSLSGIFWMTPLEYSVSKTQSDNCKRRNDNSKFVNIRKGYTCIYFEFK